MVLKNGSFNLKRANKMQKEESIEVTNSYADYVFFIFPIKKEYFFLFAHAIMYLY